MTLAVGVDVGGTKIAFALVDEQGQKVAEHRLPTKPEDGTEAVLDRIADGIRLLLKNADQPVTGVGIGSPGVVDPKGGIVQIAVNLHWIDVALADGVYQRLGQQFPVWIQNDVNAAVLGEKYYGCARDYDDFVYVGLGTGVGGGAMTGGKLVEGARFSAMEIGHVSLNPQGRLCRCGLRGCPETTLAGFGMMGAVEQYLPDFPSSSLAALEQVTTEALFDAARAGDALAVKIIDEARTSLATVFMMCASILNPSLFIIGGGLGLAAYDLLCPEIALEYVQTTTLAAIHSDLKVMPAPIVDLTIGAAALVKHYS